MRYFAIEKINNKNNYIILSTSYISPLDEIEELQNDLKKLNYNGELIIDLLICNGLSSNRFFKAYFDGKAIDLCSIKILSDVDDNIKGTSREFYKNHANILDNSTLPKPHCYIIKNGLM